MNLEFCVQVPSGGEPPVVAVLLGHGRGGELDQGDAEHPAPGMGNSFFFRIPLWDSICDESVLV